MKFQQTLLTAALLLWPLLGQAQSVSPTASYTDAEGELTETTSIDDGEAPLEVTFAANPSDMEGHLPSYEWHFRKSGSTGDFLVRYEENTSFRFTESGNYEVVLKVNFTGEELEIDSTTIRVFISESKLEFPNAFSPNGDGINDIYRAKEGYKSIVSFHAYIFNRWGKKLFEWSNPSQGWDGKYQGKDVPDGVYFVLVKAKGADGREYNIRRDVNLLRRYNERGSSTTTP